MLKSFSVKHQADTEVEDSSGDAEQSSVATDWEDNTCVDDLAAAIH